MSWFLAPVFLQHHLNLISLSLFLLNIFLPLLPPADLLLQMNTVHLLSNLLILLLLLLDRFLHLHLLLQILLLYTPFVLTLNPLHLGQELLSLIHI